MKAGAALGLLAGLGAMNAIRGGKDGTGKRFTSLIDMIDGGGAGQSGDRFEGGGLLSMLGNLFMKPMRAQQNVEEIATRTSARDRSSSPKPVLRPTMTTGTPITEYSDSLLAPIVNQDIYGIGESGEFPKTLPQPSALSGGTVQPMPSSSQDSDTGTAILTFGGGEVMPQPSMIGPDSFSANPPSEAAMTPPVPAPEERNSELASFNRRMETVPELLRGTEIEDMYFNYLRKGGLATFPQFTNQSMATEDPAVKRSPTPPALQGPNVVVPPTVPVTPEAAGLGMSDADQMVAIRSAIMRDPKMIGAFEEAFGVDMVREALAGMRMVGGAPNAPRTPLTRGEQSGLLSTMPITRFN